MTDTQPTEDAAPVQDTADTQASEASEVVTNAPEATQDQAPAQEAAAPETKAEDTATEKLYAGKYKSVEDMETAYQELNSKFTNTSQEKAELARILDETFATPEAPVAEDTEAASYEESPRNSETDALRRDNAVIKFIMLHDDADAGAMKEVLASDPMVQQIQGHDAKLEYAYLKSQSIAQPKAIAEAQKQGAKQVQAKTAEKQVAQVETAKKAAPVSQKAELIERMRKGDKQARAQVISEIPAVKEMRRMAGLE